MMGRLSRFAAALPMVTCLAMPAVAAETLPPGEAAALLQRMADATREFWSAEPWPRYVFLIAFRDARGGLEHRYSTFVNVDPERFAAPRGYAAFIALLAHEYQHAFNV